MIPHHPGNLFSGTAGQISTHKLSWLCGQNYIILYLKITDKYRNKSKIKISANIEAKNARKIN